MANGLKSFGFILSINNSSIWMKKLINTPRLFLNYYCKNVGKVNVSNLPVTLRADMHL